MPYTTIDDSRKAQLMLNTNEATRSYINAEKWTIHKMVKWIKLVKKQLNDKCANC